MRTLYLQRLTEDVLHGLNTRICFVYLDDVERGTPTQLLRYSGISV